MLRSYTQFTQFPDNMGTDSNVTQCNSTVLNIAHHWLNMLAVVRIQLLWNDQPLILSLVP